MVSETSVDVEWYEGAIVLILVLVEDGLGDLKSRPQRSRRFGVLILVLVEDGLGARRPTPNANLIRES